MKTGCGRCATLLIVSGAFFATTSGCTVGLRSFTMDSTSRMPFFGFELKEWKPKSNAPVYNSISRSQSDAARIEPAVHNESTAPRKILNLGMKNPFGSKPAEGNSNATGPIAATQSSIAIPLTFVEGSKTAIDRARNESDIDFQ